MDHIEWYTEEIKEYYCAEIDQTIASGCIYYLSQNGNKGYVLCSDETSKKNIIVSFGVFEETAIALRKKGTFFISEMIVYNVEDNTRIGSMDNGFYNRGIRYNINVKSSLFKPDPECSMKFEIFRVHTNLALSINIYKPKNKQLHNPARLTGTVSIEGDINWELIICGFFSLHNYFERSNR